MLGDPSSYLYTTAASLELISHVVTRVAHHRPQVCVGVRTYVGGEKGRRSCHITRSCTRTRATPCGTAPLNLIACIRTLSSCAFCRSDSMAEHYDFCADKCRKCAENVRCPTVISCTVCGMSLSLPLPLSPSSVSFFFFYNSRSKWQLLVVFFQCPKG